MWGNSLGWTISLLIVLLVGGWVYLVEHRASATPPTAFSRSAVPFQPLRVPELPRSMLPTSEATDAGPLYRRAIDIYLADRATYFDFATIGTLGSATPSHRWKRSRRSGRSASIASP